MHESGTAPRKLRPGIEEEVEEEILVAEPPSEPGGGLLGSLDDADIVEEAEQLLRASAPHDHDVVIIGAGAGGCACALRAAQLGLRVALVEARDTEIVPAGPDDLHFILHAARIHRLLRQGRPYGVPGNARKGFDFTALREGKDTAARLARATMAARLDKRGITILRGQARFVDEHTLQVTHDDGTTRRVSSVYVVIAAGSIPLALRVPGEDLPMVLAADAVVASLPQARRVVVAGGGALGLELAYFYHEAGAQVTLFEKSPRLLPHEDPDLGRELARHFHSYGITLLPGTAIARIDQAAVQYLHMGEAHTVAADLVVVASGRRAATAGLGLEAAGIAHDDGRIIVDLQCQTSVGGVFAIGDCIRHAGWTHQAMAEGVVVAELIANRPTARDVTLAPACYYTWPEVASVGFTHAVAARDGLDVRADMFHFGDGEGPGDGAAPGGFVKLVYHARTEKLLGCQIIGPGAVELINAATFAIATGRTLAQLAGTTCAHPTQGEILAAAAQQARGRGI